MLTTPSIQPPAHILSLTTAVPKYVIKQSEFKELGRTIFKNRPSTFARLSKAYENAGITRRYSCVPIDWYTRATGWKNRTELFVANATTLLHDIAMQALQDAKLSPADIDGIVTVSSTGLSVPSLDALLMEKIRFRRNVERLPIFGLGCAGGILGLNRVAALARATPGSKWLFLVVELCGLTFRSSDLSKSNIIATALFGDGAAGGVISTHGNGYKIMAGGEYCWPDTKEIMGWTIEEDGFGVQFSRDVPTLVRRNLRNAAEKFLSSKNIPRSSIKNFIFHPGGTKVLEALEEAFELDKTQLATARTVLQEYGNMSAPTVLFVLKKSIENGLLGKTLVGALGPGFTAGFSVLER